MFAKSVQALMSFITEFSESKGEAIRLARASVALLFAGVTQSVLFERVRKTLGKSQFEDGGWSDAEETAWAAAFLSQKKGVYKSKELSAIRWLNANRHNGGGWGRHCRDRKRIPLTALVLTLLPSAGIDDDYKWVASEWAQDLAGTVKLSYKASFYLLVAGHKSIRDDSQLIEHTITHLIGDQNDDGGFAPWKDHPIGSDPWSTGVVLWGLSKWIDHVDTVVIKRALHWLEESQLPSGFWPYHYLEEGSSYALIGAVSAMRVMASGK